MFSLTNTYPRNDKEKEFGKQAEQDEEKSNNFGPQFMGKTAPEFFNGEKYAKYLVKTEDNLIGDRQLFESENKRALKSGVNRIN